MVCCTPLGTSFGIKARGATGPSSWARLGALCPWIRWLGTEGPVNKTLVGRGLRREGPPRGGAE